VGRLEEQLAKSDQQAAAAKEDDPARRRWGPAPGGPHDRWIRYHATMNARRMMHGSLLIVLAAIAGFAFVVATDGDRQIVGVIGGVGLLLAAIAVPNYLVRRSRAIDDQRAFVSSLPFAFPTYLETMRQPKWRTIMGQYLIYHPKLRVTWAAAPTPDHVVKLCALVNATAEFHSAQELTITNADRAPDPWRWTRAVVTDALLPLAERTPLSSVSLEISHSTETRHAGGE
jgi:hypothetical protein